MKKIKIFLILLVLFISISAVYADGNFTSLENEINDSTDTFNIMQDYKYEPQADGNNTQGVIINKNNFVINGNGHTIDGNNQSRVFKIYGSNIVINDLIITNGFSDSAGGGIFNLATLTLNNVTFIKNDCRDVAGAVFTGKTAIINDCTFTDNYAPKGSAIYVEDTSTQVNKSTFTSASQFKKAFIYGTSSTIVVDNSTFANATANYATAIYNDRKTYIYDSKFLNLRAIESAGAIEIKELDEVVIDSCIFINTTSTKNAGAAFIDTQGFTYYNNGTIKIRNCGFFNCSSQFGGALVVLSGQCQIIQSTFENNHAIFDGGALYSSNGNVYIERTIFKDNKLTFENDDYKHGAAIYSDANILEIFNSHFINNAANAIYTYDSDVNITHALFKDNGEALHGVFLDNYYLSYNEYNNDTLSLNNTDYITSFEESVEQIAVVNNTIILSKLPKRYDLDELYLVSSVKDQGEMNSCWAFGTCGALESALIKTTETEYDFSENNMQNSILKYFKYGSKENSEGGGTFDSAPYVLSWFGVLSSYDDTYDEVGKISPLLTSPEKIHVQDIVFIPERTDSLDNTPIKEALMKYGALSGSYKATMDKRYYNEKTAAQYYYETNDTRINHMITIVGWDDNYSKDNFVTTPPGDGAWIIKNSYGTKYGEQGFNYISYYDTTFAKTPSVGFIFDNTEPYTINYQTDMGGALTFWYGNKISSYKNTYESIGDNIISAIGTYFNKTNEEYSFEIYINNVLTLKQNGTSPYYGYHTIKLDKVLLVEKGDNITVVMNKMSIPILKNSRQHYLSNMTFIDDNKGGWTDTSTLNVTVSLKVYAEELLFYTEDLDKIYKNETQFEAYVGQANKNVIFEVNGGSYNRITDAKGIAKMTINLNPSNYTIKTTYNGTTVENNIEVLPTLIAEDLVKYYMNGSQFYISLIDGEGNAVSGATISMNINGVFYDRVTNENGTARLNINLNPGEYILTAIDPLTGLTMSYTIKVLPVLTGSDVKMTYKDGTQYKAKLVDGKGKAMANEPVTFNINGVFYTRITDNDGIAKLNINLMPGEYIITSQYGRAMNSNKITISSKEE